MLVSMTVRRRSSALILLAALASCSEPIAGPQAPNNRPSATGDLTVSAARQPRRARRVRAHETYDSDSKTTTYTFTIDPNVAQRVVLGDHEVFLPARVICDPQTTSYGSTEWETPCTVATEPITFRAIAGKREGHAAIDFEPDVRFVPSSADDRSRWVILTLRDRKALKDNREYSILWWDADAESNSGKGDDKGAWVDESLTDETLLAWTDRRGNKVSRRLKHFSGYNVSERRGGYNVTSGRR